MLLHRLYVSSAVGQHNKSFAFLSFLKVLYVIFLMYNA